MSEGTSSNGDHHLDSAMVGTKNRISHHNLCRERDLQEPTNQSDMIQETTYGCTKKSKRGPPKMSSNRGKLFLRKDTNDSTKETASAASQANASKEVMKAILGETSFNQSSDFKEPWSHGSGPHVGLRGKKKAIGYLSRSKVTKSQKDSGPSGSGTPNLNTCSHNDGKPGANLTEMSLVSCSKVDKSSTSTGEPPLKDCSVYISKLNLSPSEFARESSSSLGDIPRSGQFLSGSLQPAISNNCSKLGSAQSKFRTKPLLSPPHDKVSRKCPVCDKTFPGNSACVLQNHVQTCLRRKFAKSVKARDDTDSTGDTISDEELARALQRREEEKMQEEILTETEKFFCQICQRDLSHMNSTRRTQHINRCLDTVEALEPKHQAAPIIRSKMVPDCPICGKHFKTQLQRKSHLKKCARQQQISAQRLIVLVREQEEEAIAGGDSEGAASGEALGGVPGGAVARAKEGPVVGASSTVNVRPACLTKSIGVDGIKASAGIEKSSDATAHLQSRGRGGKAMRGRGKRKQKQPTATQMEHVDEDVQVALALSASLIQDNTTNQSAERAVSIDLPVTLGKPAQIGRNKKKGKKETVKEVPLLLRRTEDEHKKVLEQRVADIVLPLDNAMIQKTPCMRRSKVAPKYESVSPRQPRCVRLAEAVAMASCHANKGSNPKASIAESIPNEATMKSHSDLWDLASACDESRVIPYYVNQLLPAVTPQKRPSPIKRATRGLTSRQVSVEVSSQQKAAFPEPSQPATSLCPSQDGSATQALGQTVHILAELAAESALRPCTQSSDGSLIVASGFIPPEVTKDDKNEDQGTFRRINPAQEEVLQSLSGLVNSQNLSDLHIVTSDQSLIFAHQFLISLRCPSLALLVEDAPSQSNSSVKKLDLLGFKDSTVLCALDFMYAGKMTVTSDNAREVGQFADRFSLTELSNFCRKLTEENFHSVSACDIPMQEIQPDVCDQSQQLGQNSDEFLPDKGLDELMQSLWESSSSSEDETENSLKDEENCVSDVDGGKMLSSQSKRKVSHRMSDTESDAEGKDSVPDEEDLEEIYEYFSTQRQKSGHGNHLKGPDFHEDASGERIQENSSKKVSGNHRRHSLTIIEQLQSSCQPQNSRSSTNQSDLGDVGRNLSRGIVLEKSFEKNIHGSTSSDDVINSSLERVTTPCFIFIKKLSDDTLVSPVKENLPQPTIGSCLHNLKPRDAKEWKQGKDEMQKPEMAWSSQKTLKKPDATLADVGDSIFSSSDENDADVDKMDLGQAGELEGMGNKSDETSLFKADGEFEEDVNHTVSLFDSSADVSCSDATGGRAVSSERESAMSRDASGSSGTEGKSLPFVYIKSQPHEGGIRNTGTNSDNRVTIRSDEEQRLSRCGDAVMESKDVCVDNVIDLSQDEEIEHVVAPEVGPNSFKDMVQDLENIKNDLGKDGDMFLETKSSDRIKTLHPAKKSSPGRPLVTKPQKFTFKRRDKKPITKDLADTKPLNKVDVLKRVQSEMFTSVSDTPAAFRTADNLIKESSTPMFGENYRGAGKHHGFIMQKISPIKENTEDKNHDYDERIALGLMLDEGKPCRSVNLSKISSLDKELVSGGSPVLKENEQRLQMTRKTNINQSNPIEQPSSLPSTPLKLTSDSFNADTPEIISFIPPPPLSPSPPPSPTFGLSPTFRLSHLIQKDTSSPSLSAVSCDDIVVNEESLTTKRKRKLQTEDSSGGDDKITFKRPKNSCSQMPCSVIDANHLSPACNIEEDFVFYPAKDDKNEALSSRANLKTNFQTTALTSISWPDHLSVGRSPTRLPSESSSEDIEVDDQNVSVTKSSESSNLLIEVQEASQRPRITACPSFSPASPVKAIKNLNSFASPKKASEFSSELQRLRWLASSQDRIKSQVTNSSQKSDADAANVASPSLQDISEDQFAYYGADDGGFMDDFNFCCQADPDDPHSEKPSPQQNSSQTNKDPSTSGRGEATTPVRTSRSCHSNISIESFRSSDDASSFPTPQLAISTSQGNLTNVLSKSVLLRNEAEEFGCSESFLCQLKEGNIDEEKVWGGVALEGSPSFLQSKDKRSRARGQVKRIPATTTKQTMSKEAIDALYHPPAPVTPMPSYDDMNTPHLKNELKKYGVKPLQKKKARLKLKEIYHHTHQVLEDSDSDTDTSEPAFKLPASSKPASSKPASSKPASSKPASSKPASSKPASSKPASSKSAPSKSASSKQPSRKAHSKKAAPLTGGGWKPGTKGGERDIDSQNTGTESGDNDDSDQSEYGSTEDCPEGEYEEDEYEIMPSQMTAANLEQAIKTYIQSKPDLYEKILCYEPLELDDFHTELKNAGIKYSKNNLREFLDNHGITFRVITTNTQRHVRKSRKPKETQGNPRKPKAK